MVCKSLPMSKQLAASHAMYKLKVKEGRKEGKRLGTELTSYFHNRKYTSDLNLGNFLEEKNREREIVISGRPEVREPGV